MRLTQEQFDKIELELSTIDVSSLEAVDVYWLQREAILAANGFDEDSWCVEWMKRNNL